MRLGLGPIVETENTLDDILELFGHMHRTDAAAVRSARMLVCLERHAERFTEIRDGAGEHYRPSSHITRDHREAMHLRKTLDLVEVSSVSTVRLFELLLGHVCIAVHQTPC